MTGLRYNMDMVIVGILSWWYGRGLAEQIAKIRAKLMASFDYFSIDLLAKTLFSPFRQIDAGKVRGPIGVQMRAFFDRLFSRIVGGVVRTIIMLVGVVWMASIGLVSLVGLAVWLCMPLVPFIAAALWIGGFIPWHL